MNRLADHRRTTAVFLQKVVFLFDKLCLFKLHARGVVHHCLFQRTKHAAQVALDDFSDLGNHGVVIFFGNQAFAGAVAFVDMIVEADLVLTFLDTRFRQRCAAGTHLINLTEQVQQNMRCTHRGIRAEVLRAVVHFSSCQENTRKSLLLDADPRVGLVVLEHDVVARLVLLDHRVLQQQCLSLRVDDAVFEVGDFAHEDARLTRLFLVEIAADAAFQVLGFTYVNQFALFVEIAVHARLVGQRSELLFYYFGEDIHYF